MDNKKKGGLNDYLKYSGIAMQMFLVAFLGAFAGSKIDKYFNFTFPAFTLLLLFIAIFAVFYKIYKELS